MQQVTSFNCRTLLAEVKIGALQDLILKGFDKECREFIQKLYQDLGITVHLDSSPTKLEKSDGGKIKMTVKHKDDKEEALEGIDHVLFATGRKPNTQGLGLEELGVEMDPKGGVKVRSSCTPAALFCKEQTLSSCRAGRQVQPKCLDAQHLGSRRCEQQDTTDTCRTDGGQHAGQSLIRVRYNRAVSPVSPSLLIEV